MTASLENPPAPQAHWVCCALLARSVPGCSRRRRQPPGGCGRCDAAALADEFIDTICSRSIPRRLRCRACIRFDDQLEDYSRAGVDQNVRRLHEYEQRLMAIDAAPCPSHLRAIANCCCPMSAVSC
jgi:hypothetical protein